MLDKLIESKNKHHETKSLRRFLFGTSTIAISGIIFTLIFSLFNQNIVLGQDNINLSSLIAPTLIPDTRPQPPEQIKKSKSKLSPHIKSNIAQRKLNILRLDESPQKMPATISTTPSNYQARPNTDFELGTNDSDAPQSFSFNSNEKSQRTTNTGFDTSSPKEIEPTVEKTKVTIPPPPTPPAPKVEKVNTVVSGGVVNGKAQNLVNPIYSAAARSANIKGKVTIQVLISEDGKVISAQVLNGHALLRNNAINAARKSTFTPTLLSNQRVKVKGVIIYNFN
jgi:TonB family protein